MIKVIRRLAAGLLVAFLVTVADCGNYGDSGNIALLVILFVISLPWNFVLPYAIGALGLNWHAIYAFHGAVWKAMSCHDGRAYQDLYVLFLFAAIGAFINTVLVVWSIDWAMHKLRTKQGAQDAAGT